MKIFVVNRTKIKKLHKKDPEFHKKNWIISIFSSEMEDQNGSSQSYSPLPNASNILKLKFDDVMEQDPDFFIHFNKNLANKIVEFVKSIPDNGEKNLFIHCDAGVSRSGAVGFLLNEWFNKFLTDNKEDDKFFKETNSHIMPNPEVVKILKHELFGPTHRGIFVNEYTYNEDGIRIDNIKEVLGPL